MRGFDRIAVQGLASLFVLAGVARAQTWTMTDLDPAGTWDSTFAYGMSQTGHVAGVGYNATTGEIHALRFANGVIQDLGMFGYPYGGDAVAINDSDQVLGTGYGPGFHALIWHNGQITHLDGPEGGSSEGYAINNLGHVVGRVAADDGGFQPFTYIGGNWSLMAASIVQALAINDSDQIVGSTAIYWTYGGYGHSAQHGMLLSGGVITDLGNVGGGIHTDTVATAINGAGTVVGWSTAADLTVHAFRWSSGAIQDLGTIAPYYAYPTSINSSGLIIGNLQTYVGGPVEPFICVNGVMSTLASHLDASGSAWSDLTVSRLNDDGWISGSGTINGSAHAFIARPVAGAVTSVGAGCGGAGTPAFSSNVPQIGHDVILSLSQGSPNKAGALFYSSVPSSALPLGGGCTVQLDLATFAELLPVATNSSGAWSLMVPLPSDPALAGLIQVMQIALFGTSGPLGFDLSNGLVATIGW